MSIILSLIVLPQTIVQLQTLFSFGARPIRLDYLIYLWAFIPWVYGGSNAPNDGGSSDRTAAVKSRRNDGK